MVSTQEGSSEPGSEKGKKTEKGRRSWSPTEEETLIAALKELVAEGWKSDNGFRAGYLNKLEDALKKQFPGTDLRAHPHIYSKISIWKKNYYSLTQMLQKSGVGFNLNGTFKIDCDDEQWDCIVKRDGNARAMRYKPWPYLEEWKEIFGKDRADGANAEDIVDAVHEIEQESANIAEEFLAGDYHVSLDDMFESNHGDDSVCQSQQPDQGRKQKGKKRKSEDDGIETVCALLGEISRNTNTRLEALASRIGYDQDLGKARMEVFEKLGHIPDLSLDDKFNICEILADKKERLEIFMGLPQDAQGMYVNHLLNSNK